MPPRRLPSPQSGLAGTALQLRSSRHVSSADCFANTHLRTQNPQVEELLAPRTCRHAFVSADDATCLESSGSVPRPPMRSCRLWPLQIRAGLSRMLLGAIQVQGGRGPRDRVRKGCDRARCDPRGKGQHRREGRVHKRRPCSARHPVVAHQLNRHHPPLPRPRPPSGAPSHV